MLNEMLDRPSAAGACDYVPSCAHYLRRDGMRLRFRFACNDRTLASKLIHEVDDGKAANIC